MYSNSVNFGKRTNYATYYDDLMLQGRQSMPRGLKTFSIDNVMLSFVDGIIPKRVGDNPSIGIVEGLQILAGEFDISEIKKVAPNAKLELFSNHSAYGPRIKGQIEKVINELKQDQDTRRAQIIIADMYEPKEELPCTTQIQFQIVNDLLDVSVYLRSSDATWGIPYDLIQYGIIQQVVAKCLGIDYGAITLLIGNGHLYEFNRYQGEWGYRWLDVKLEFGKNFDDYKAAAKDLLAWIRKTDVTTKEINSVLVDLFLIDSIDMKPVRNNNAKELLLSDDGYDFLFDDENDFLFEYENDDEHSLKDFHQRLCNGNYDELSLSQNGEQNEICNLLALVKKEIEMLLIDFGDNYSVLSFDNLETVEDGESVILIDEDEPFEILTTEYADIFSTINIDDSLFNSAVLSIALNEISLIQEKVSSMVPGSITKEVTNDQIRTAALSLIDEVLELTKELGWKPWKKDIDFSDVSAAERVVEEFGDVIAFLGYFVLLIMKRTGLDSTDLSNGYFNRVVNNINRFSGKTETEKGYYNLSGEAE